MGDFHLWYVSTGWGFVRVVIFSYSIIIVVIIIIIMYGVRFPAMGRFNGTTNFGSY